MNVNTLRQLAKRLVERTTGFEIERHDSAFGLIPVSRRTDAWFSYRGLVKTLLDEQRVDLVVDVGANEGQFAKRLRKSYAGEIVSCEPAAAAFARLETASARDDLWGAHQVALGRAASTLTLHVARDSVFSSPLSPNPYLRQRFGPGAVDTHEEIVPVHRLDDFLSERVKAMGTRRVFLKIDTQGYDLEVFGGVGATLDQVHLLQSEVSLIPIYDGMPHWTDSIAVYEKAGFGVVGMFPVGFDGRRVIEFDCLMARVESLG